MLRNKNEIEMQTFHENDNEELPFEKEAEKDHNEGSNIFDRFFSVMPKKYNNIILH